MNVSIFETERKTPFRRYTADKELLFATIRRPILNKQQDAAIPNPATLCSRNYIERLKRGNSTAVISDDTMTDGKIQLQLSGFLIVSRCSSTFRSPIGFLLRTHTPHHRSNEHLIRCCTTRNYAISPTPTKDWPRSVDRKYGRIALHPLHDTRILFQNYEPSSIFGNRRAIEASNDSVR